MINARVIIFIFLTSFFFIWATFSSIFCLAQTITTRPPEGLGMTENYDYYVLFLDDDIRTALAMVSINDTIHICPFITHTKDNALFKSVTAYEFGHYYNYVNNSEVLKTETPKEEEVTTFIADSMFWKTSLLLENISFKGSDGSSMEKAIIIKKVSSMKDGIAAEYAFLEEKLGTRGISWKPLGQYLVPSRNKYYDLIMIEMMNTKEIKYFWFDITKFFGRL